MAAKTYSIVSLGCPKNLVDSERMLGLLKRHGYKLVPNPEGADFVLINTCGFIDVARQESIDVIREMLRLKKRGKIRGVIVAGCMAERDRENLLEKYPDIDQLVGVFGREEIVLAADRLRDELKLDPGRTIFREAPSCPLPDEDRLRLTPRHLAYLRIAEGCNQLCTFCSIPKMRGPYSSKQLDRVVSEAEQLAADGARELIVIAQDTSSYGIDLKGQPLLASLLKRLCRVEGVAWIRLMYAYPRCWTDELIELMASERKIVPYIDLPLQHINDTILKRMKRQVTRAETEALLDRLRGRIEGLVLRTTFITGFPGETEEQFQELFEFVAARRFERLGAFAYSREPDTPAARLPEACPESVAEARRDRLLAAQQEIAFAWNQAQVGRTKEILIDAAVPDEPDAWVGRSHADAPEIDGVVYVSGEGLRPGQMVSCEIVAAEGYDLVAAAT